MMVEAKLVTIEELKTDNPTLCLSALRVFDKCHQCLKFKIAARKNRVSKLKCTPHVNKAYYNLLELRKKVSEQLNRVNRAIDQL